MELKDNDNNENILETINEKLNKIEVKVDEIDTKIKNPKSFVASTLMALGLILFSISLSIYLQLGGFSKEVLWSTIISYGVIGVGLIVIGLLFILKKD